jgi:hypothetical protein
VNLAIATPTAKVNSATRTAKVLFFIATSQYLTIVFFKQRTAQVGFLARNNCYFLDASDVKKFRQKQWANLRRRRSLIAAHGWSVATTMGYSLGCRLRSNPGLKLANAFGVFQSVFSNVDINRSREYF